MGAYLNPNNTSKEQWLQANAESLDRAPAKHDAKAGMLPVCLINNGFFTAGAICYSAGELSEFANPADRRGKAWFLAPIEELKKHSNLGEYLR